MKINPVELEGLLFVLESNTVKVLQRGGKRIGWFSALDSNGLLRIGTQEDLEMESMWWLRDNGGLRNA